MKISIRMKTLNTGGVMIRDLESFWIATADRSYLPCFITCLLSFLSKSLMCPIRVKSNIMQNRQLTQNCLNDPKWKGWIIYKQKYNMLPVVKKHKFCWKEHPGEAQASIAIIRYCRANVLAWVIVMVGVFPIPLDFENHPD